jgi:hypothetical protein
MNKRLVCLGLLAAASQFFATGCYCFHPVATWRANHPYAPFAGCGACGAIEARRPVFHRYAGELPSTPVVGGAVVGSPGMPVTSPPCHGCGAAAGYPTGSVGYPVGFNGGPTEVFPATNTPVIGSPMPITPGPMVVPGGDAHPLQMPRTNP